MVTSLRASNCRFRNENLLKRRGSEDIGTANSRAQRLSVLRSLKNRSTQTWDDYYHVQRKSGMKPTLTESNSVFLRIMLSLYQKTKCQNYHFQDSQRNTTPPTLNRYSLTLDRNSNCRQMHHIYGLVMID